MGKKNKVTYVDDGRTIADMSGIGGPRLHRNPNAPRSSGKDKWDTYWNAVKMMFVPMLVTLAVICLAFGIAYLLL